jgi:NADP-dependent 3-hydroxy acid dehydrogenase YdfG
VNIIHKHNNISTSKPQVKTFFNTFTRNLNTNKIKMSKPIAVIMGATGGQGGSVVDSFLKDGTYQVRGITRNANSEKAKALQKRGVEVTTGDLNDVSSLVQAFQVCQF